MAIPDGYRLLMPTDSGKVFGVDLDPHIWFDTSVTPLIYEDAPDLVSFWDAGSDETLGWLGGVYSENKITLAGTDLYDNGWISDNVALVQSLDLSALDLSLFGGTGVVQVKIGTTGIFPDYWQHNNFFYVKPTKPVNKVTCHDAVLIDMTADTVTADKLVEGEIAHDKSGAKITGTMPNNGSTSATIDGLTATSVSIPAGYTSGGTVSLTSDIEDALAAI